MLALLAAATLAAAQPAPAPSSNILVLRGAYGRLDLLGPGPASVCNREGRMQALYPRPDPALLYPGDREQARAKRLIDLPMAYMCRVDAPKTEEAKR
jgi:hypothetical protein